MSPDVVSVMVRRARCFAPEAPRRQRQSQAVGRWTAGVYLQGRQEQPRPDRPGPPVRDQTFDPRDCVGASCDTTVTPQDYQGCLQEDQRRPVDNLGTTTARPRSEAFQEPF